MLRSPLVLSLTLAIAVGALSPALADGLVSNPPSPPTVTLTQAELQAIVKAESAKAIAQYEAQNAAPVYQKLQAAFSPKSVAIPALPPEISAPPAK